MLHAKKIIFSLSTNEPRAWMKVERLKTKDFFEINEMLKACK